jgi:two-component system response regulator
MRFTGSILLVEDNPDDVALTLRAFEKAGLANRIEVARDGVEAMEFLSEAAAAAAKGAAMPAVVLLDLKLPRLDGLEVLRRMRGDPLLRLVPVVVLTSSLEERDLVESYALGANSFVRKPVDFKEFLDAAGKLGLYWLLLNERPPAR